MEAAQRHRSGDSDDLSALAWVQDELRKSLEAAHKSLRRFVQDAEPAAARTSTTSIRRSCASRASRCTRASARSRWSACRAARTCCAPASRRCRSSSQAAGAVHRGGVAEVERAGFALLEYLARRWPASRSRRWRCSRSTATCRSWPAPTACIPPTCGRGLALGAMPAPTSLRAPRLRRRLRARIDQASAAHASRPPTPRRRA